MVTSVMPDAIACDGCMDQVAEFADVHLASKEIPEAIKCVETHLDQCLCCKDEFAALKKALIAIAD